MQRLPNPYDDSDQIPTLKTELEISDRYFRNIEEELARKGGRRHTRLMEARQECSKADEEYLQARFGKYRLSAEQTECP